MVKDRPLSYLPTRSPRTPRSDSVSWVSYGPSSNRWTTTAESPGAYGAYGTSVLPPPPRPPAMQALLTSYEYDDRKRSREIQHFSCWRLRWAAACLVIANAMQASLVGSQLQQFYGSAPAGGGAAGGGAALFTACALLGLLLIALWSLLSQLLCAATRPYSRSCRLCVCVCSPMLCVRVRAADYGATRQ